MENFRHHVLTIVKKIPKGQVMSYREVAELAGNPLAARAVGAIMRDNFDPTIPCHRVIRSDGRPGGYNLGSEKKVAILKKEGADIKT